MGSESKESVSVSKSQCKRFSGIVTPLVTPATDNGQVDIDGTIRLMETIVTADTHPFLFGTSGEASSISKEEKIWTASHVLPQFVERATVYMGISSNCFEESIALAKAFADLGAHVVVSTLPSYLSLNPDQMRNYFEQLADAIPLPLIIYNIPVTTHMSVPLETVEMLSQHPNIVGLKDSERDLDRLKSASTQYKDRNDFSHLTGWAPQSVNALQWGSDGLVPVTANRVPQRYVELYSAVGKSDTESAIRLQNETNEVSKLFQENRSLGESLAAMKALLSISGICGTAMFPPLTSVSEEELEGLKSRWTEINAS